MNQELNTTSTQAAPPMGIAALAPIILQMLTTRAGGLAGLVKMFTDKGLGEIASSWVSKGPNLPITGEQVRSALGDDLIGQIAAKGGIAPDNMVSQIAVMLPGLVDELTPDGTIPEESVMHKAVDFMKSKFM
jgi:uncharacterized protein YidB (DUF937 family)